PLPPRLRRSDALAATQSWLFGVEQRIELAGGELAGLHSGEEHAGVGFLERVFRRAETGAVAEVDHGHDLAPGPAPVRARGVQRPSGVEGRIAGRERLAGEPKALRGDV